jgi:carbon-monoxide dehydrogenase medium subunit
VCCVFRAKSIEAAQSEKFAPDAVTRIRVPAEGLNADMHGGADYRAHLIGGLAGRAVERALATGGKR